MKISHKLILSFLLVASFAGFTMFFALHSYSRINGAFAGLRDDPTQMVMALNDLRHAGTEIVSSTSEFAFLQNESVRQGEEDVPGEEERQVIAAGRQKFETSISRYEELVHNVATDEIESLENIRAAGNQLIKTSSDIIELKRRHVIGTEVLEKRRIFKADELIYQQYVQKALEHESDEQIDEQTNVQSTIALATRETLIATALAFLLAILAGFYISYLISRRVGKLKEAIRRVGTGELETRIESNSKDEIGELAHLFNEMVGDLRTSGETLRLSEERHRQLFESNPFPMWMYDIESLAFLAVNNAAVHHYGYTREEFLAMTIKDIRPLNDVPILLDHMTTVYSAAKPTNIWKHRKKDGTIFDAEITAYGMVFDGRPAEFVLAHDVTERLRLDSESRLISEIIRGIATTSNLEKSLQMVHRSIGKMLYAENCYIALYDAKTQVFSMPFCIDKYDEAAPPTKLGSGLTAYVFRTRKAYLLTANDIDRLRDEGDIEMVGTQPAVWMGVPLITPGGVSGVMAVQHYEDPEAYNQHDLAFLHTVGAQIALITESKLAAESLRRSEERYRDLIENAHDIIFTEQAGRRIAATVGGAIP